MTERQPARRRAHKSVESDEVAVQTAKISARKPTSKPAKSVPNPLKLVRKGRKPVAGAQLRRELSWPKAGYAAKTLIVQAARLADRLEVLSRLLDGDANAWLAVRVAGVVVQVGVDDVVREERQLSETLRKLVGDIEKMRAVDEGGKSGGGPVADPLPGIVAAHYPKKRA